jgi:hypothetical protein
MVTFIDERKVRDKQDFGRCYLMAGFKFAGRTKKDDLLALQLPVTKAIDIWIDYHQAGKQLRTNRKEALGIETGRGRGGDS